MRRARTDNGFKNRVFGEWVTADITEPSDTEAQVSARWRMSNKKSVEVLTYQGENYSPLMPASGDDSHFHHYGQETTKYFKKAFDYSAIGRLTEGGLKAYVPDPKFEIGPNQHGDTSLRTRRDGINGIFDSLIFVRGHFYSKCEDPTIQLAPKNGVREGEFKVTITAPTKFWPYNRFNLHSWLLPDHDRIAEHYREWYGAEVDFSKRNVEVFDPNAFTTELESELLAISVKQLFRAFDPVKIEWLADRYPEIKLTDHHIPVRGELNDKLGSLGSYSDIALDTADVVPDLASELLELFEQKIGPLNQIMRKDPGTLLPAHFAIVDLAATKARYDTRPLSLDESFASGFMAP